ncbi:MAG: hypothetical protein IKM29_02265 [Clostridia bacterium]|nr:hypothetical protein [Clostridia bacterium]
MKAGKIVLGVLFIAAAVVLILEAVGVISPVTSVIGDITFWQAIGGIAVIAAGTLLSWKHFGFVFLLIGFLFMIFERNIAYVCGMDGGDIINNWLVFGCSILLSVGFFFLTPKRKKWTGSCRSAGAGVSVKGKSNKMGAASVYIDCEEFGNTDMVRSIENKLGAIEVHFENTESYLGGGTLYIDSKIGAVEICVPKEWKVNTDDLEVSVGVIDTNCDKERADGPELIIKGRVDIGAMEISRV